MCRSFRHTLILAVFFLVFCPLQTSFAGMGGPVHLVPPELLKFANLRLVWESSLPMKKNESMERMLVLGNRFYAISDRNFAMGLNRTTGQKIFNRTIALEGLTADGFTTYGDEIMYFVGDKYIELEAATGVQKKVTDVAYGIACAVARNDSFFYISGIDKRLHVCDANDRMENFKVAAENGSMITAVNAAEDYVVFGTDKGNIYSMLPDAPSKLWQFDAAGGVVGQIIRDSNSLYFSGDDMNVYKLDVPDKYTRKFVWKTMVPGMVQKPPRVTSTMIYQSAFSGNMSVSAIDKDSGNIVWTVPGGIELLAQSRGRAYIITEDGTLVVMDNASGKKTYSVNFTGVSRYAFNTLDAKIYIGDKAGRIACLEPLN